jgi:hypothetical protein
MVDSTVVVIEISISITQSVTNSASRENRTSSFCAADALLHKGSMSTHFDQEKRRRPPPVVNSRTNSQLAYLFPELLDPVGNIDQETRRKSVRYVTELKLKDPFLG